MFRVVCLLIGYACGLFQTSYIIGRRHHIDIREYGSGNAGTTNAMRVMGRRAGALTLVCDCLKCLVALGIARCLFASFSGDAVLLPCLYAGAGCILGHNFPFYLGFKGGKGIAASVGLILGLDIRIFLVCAVVFFLIFFITHYVSAASILAYITAFVTTIVYCCLGFYDMSVAFRVEMCALMGCLAALAIWRHGANISRLIQGTENKVYLTGNRNN